MHIAVKTEDSQAVLELQGRFDAHEVDQVREQMGELLDRGIADLTFDLRNIVFIDSKALALLVQGMKRCRESGGDLTLACLSQPVQIIMELTKLDRAFTIVDEYEFAKTA